MLIRSLIVISALLLLGFIFNIANNENSEILINENSHQPKVAEQLEKTPNEANKIALPNQGLTSLMGKTSTELINQLGKPARIDRSFYDYEWWVYPNDYEEYFQVGIADNKVVTIYATGAKAQIPPFKIGQSIGEIYTTTQIETNINIDYQNGSYRFELSEDDLNSRPIILIGDFYAQLYIDKFTGTLSSVRLLNAETLIKQHPYEMVYRGELLEAEPLSEMLEEEADLGKSRQIFDLTNVIRVRFGIKPLEWDEQTAEAAFVHSKDMYESQQFSHTSEKNGELADRLEASSVVFQMAGENIAANYIDAPAAMEGWLNSKGHRESLLNEEFTHLGVGVYKRHYTQNFISKWQN